MNTAVQTQAQNTILATPKNKTKKRVSVQRAASKKLKILLDKANKRIRELENISPDSEAAYLCPVCEGILTIQGAVLSFNMETRGYTDSEHGDIGYCKDCDNEEFLLSACRQASRFCNTTGELMTSGYVWEDGTYTKYDSDALSICEKDKLQIMALAEDEEIVLGSNPTPQEFLDTAFILGLYYWTEFED